MLRSISGDVVVVGGGLVGASVAYELSVAGLGVVVLDAALAGRASDAGAGIASPQTFPEDDPEWYRFGRAAADHLRTLVERLRQDDADPGPDAFAQCGSLVLALAEHEDPWFEQQLALATARDSQVEEVSVSEACAMFPPLGRPWRALYSPGSSRVDGRLLTRALHRAAARHGVEAVTEGVTAIERRRDGGLSVTGTGVEVACRNVVLAAGAWSAPLARRLGPVLPVSPTKGEIVHMVLPESSTRHEHDSARWPIVQPVLNFYLVPWPGGRVACGGTFEPGAGFDVRPTAGGVRDLLRECLTIAPGLAGATLVETRVGLRPSCADDRPALGPLPGAPDVHACTGHGANGLLLGPYSGALVAAEITGRHTPGNRVIPYAATRFSEG